VQEFEDPVRAGGAAESVFPVVGGFRQPTLSAQCAVTRIDCATYHLDPSIRDGVIFRKKRMDQEFRLWHNALSFQVG
jgi:hypothetical protein